MRMISEAEREEIEKLLFLDVDELYSLIAPFDPQYSRTWFSPEGQRDAGQKLFEKMRDALKQKICDEWDACKKSIATN